MLWFIAPTIFIWCFFFSPIRSSSLHHAAQAFASWFHYPSTELRIQWAREMKESKALLYRKTECFYITSSTKCSHSTRMMTVFIFLPMREECKLFPITTWIELQWHSVAVADNNLVYVLENLRDNLLCRLKYLIRDRYLFAVIFLDEMTDPRSTALTQDNILLMSFHGLVSLVAMCT